jgi:hypothetical protein
VPPERAASRIGWTATRLLTLAGTMREYLVSLAVIPGLGIACGAFAGAGGTPGRLERACCPGFGDRDCR